MTPNIRDRMEAYLHDPETKIPMCSQCKHYYPHYSSSGYSFGCGHCVKPRMKPRKAYDLCEHFEAKGIPEEGRASKILQRVQALSDRQLKTLALLESLERNDRTPSK